MAGALNVPGNVHPPFAESDGTAEWNMYWDPVSAARVWESNIPITLVGLDVTNKVPVTDHFLARLAAQNEYPLSRLASQCWAFTIGTGYHLWDTLTTLTVGYPDIVCTHEAACEVVLAGPSEGRLQHTPHGRVVEVAFDVDPERVYDTVLTLLRQ